MTALLYLDDIAPGQVFERAAAVHVQKRKKP
ncbi:hypothetical protein SAMN05443247_08746 [Bradyrhizobium erythrophlei]|nr:hypothetical protein SAMN05443247_08746 [Bradyrhizobium erythrophlei]